MKHFNNLGQCGGTECLSIFTTSVNYTPDGGWIGWAFQNRAVIAVDIVPVRSV